MNEFKYRKVMIIDDNDIDLYVTTRMIKTYKVGEEVLTFNSAKKALEYLQAHIGDEESLPDVMLVDIYMPLMSGFEFMAAYRDFPEELRRKTRVYIISSSIDETDIRKANEDPNVRAFHEKPITREFLQNSL